MRSLRGEEDVGEWVLVVVGRHLLGRPSDVEAVAFVRSFARSRGDYSSSGQYPALSAAPPTLPPAADSESEARGATRSLSPFFF